MLSTYGCPLKKFKPIGTAPYLVPQNSNIAESWPAILTNFSKAMVEWIKSGAELVSKERHEERFSSCRRCEYYIRFSCAKCGCVMYIKSKLASTTCEEGKWPN